MSKTRKDVTLSTGRRFVQKRIPELSNKTINELLSAIDEGLALDYLNDVEPSNNLVLC